MNTNRFRAFGLSIIMLMFILLTWERSTTWVSWLGLAIGLIGLGIAIFQKKWPD
jgi:hypothetical protein